MLKTFGTLYFEGKSPHFWAACVIRKSWPRPKYNPPCQLKYDQMGDTFGGTVLYF